MHRPWSPDGIVRPSPSPAPGDLCCSRKATQSGLDATDDGQMAALSFLPFLFGFLGFLVYPTSSMGSRGENNSWSWPWSCWVMSQHRLPLLSAQYSSHLLPYHGTVPGNCSEHSSTVLYQGGLSYVVGHGTYGLCTAVLASVSFPSPSPPSPAIQTRPSLGLAMAMGKSDSAG
jgi:hypothetical protein